MKKILSLLLLCVGLNAADITFVWLPNPPGDGVTEYRIYELVDNAPELRVTIPMPGDTRGTVTGAVMDRDRVYFATAFNGLESDRSDMVTIKAMPSPPPGFKIEVIVTVQVGGG